MSRQPAVAGRFYPDRPQSLEQTIRAFIPGTIESKVKAIGAIAPHAGYVYSGQCAAETLSRLIIPETVIILGPNHHGRGVPIALSTQPWQMPFGKVPIDTAFTDALLATTDIIEINEEAHQYEHSLEVQVPILQFFQPRLKIVPLAVSHISFGACQKVAEALAKTARDYSGPCLFLASTDMSHYVSRETAERLDTLALDKLKGLDPKGLYSTVLDNRISMCGFIPVTIVLQVSMLLGATHAEIVQYTDSGEVSGDTNQVVGYAGAIIA